MAVGSDPADVVRIRLDPDAIRGSQLQPFIEANTTTRRKGDGMRRIPRVIGSLGADFLAFFKRLAHTYRHGELHVILDNSSTHTTRLWTHGSLHTRACTFIFTPIGASWLNMVEAWFSILTRKSVRRGSFDTGRALIRHIERYLA